MPIDWLLIALDAHMFNHNGYGPGTRAQGPKAAGPGPGGGLDEPGEHFHHILINLPFQAIRLFVFVI